MLLSDERHKKFNIPWSTEIYLINVTYKNLLEAAGNDVKDILQLRKGVVMIWTDNIYNLVDDITKIVYKNVMEPSGTDYVVKVTTQDITW